MAKGWGRYRWLDYRLLAERLVRVPAPRESELVEVKLFTARVTHPPESRTRQDTYLRALEVRREISIVQGAFEKRSVRCAVCAQWYERPQEKQTDVNFSVHLLADAYEGRMDTAVVVTADADLAPTVRHVQQLGTRVMLVSPPKRHSEELSQAADGQIHIQRTWLNQSQLPDPVEYKTSRGKVRRLHQPETWAADPSTPFPEPPDAHAAH